MGRYQQLMGRIADGQHILMDGATGTEIERRGVPQLKNAWNGGGALSHPDVVRAVHEDYIREGAQIVIANTFATHRSALREAGVAHEFEALNRQGMALAIEARERLDAPHVLVAGGISYWSWSGNWPEPSDVQADTQAQASIMADAGADLLMLEMMVDTERMLVALDAAQASGLPVWVGLSCTVDPSGAVRLVRGGLLADALQALRDQNVPLINIMHTHVGNIAACLDVVAAHWPGAVGVYADSSKPVGNTYAYNETVSPQDYAAHATLWIERGVQAIGACCGLGVEHIRALKPLF